MKKLTLVRNALSRGQSHRALADAIWRNRDLTDRDVHSYLKPSGLVNAFNAPLVNLADPDAIAIGHWISRQESRPDFLITAPTLRARQTLSLIERGDDYVQDIPWVIDERVIGQNYGAAYDEYDGVESFFAHNPQEEMRFEELGAYYYVYPKGESLSHTYERASQWVKDTLVKYADYEIYVIADESFFVCVRCAIECWDRYTFLRIAHDPKLRPNNCMMTHYSDRGKGLQLRFYNRNVNEYGEYV